MWSLGLGALGCGGSAPATETPPPPTGDITVSPGFGDVARSGTAGGPDGETRCPGFFPAEPQHRLTLTGNQLEMHVEGAGEGLALFIRQGNNVFCNEAGESPTQVSRGAWSRGEYEIRVGTVAAGGSVPYVLRVVEDR